ncbi:MAG TPA: CARDB domain-containing protein, partial [Actinomycetota bacterium]|nr:CARDB domain-containing protein [Actinomycetota bacterium]
ADLYGQYFFGDFCSGRIWTATDASGSWVATEALSSSLSISSFGEDEAGELYVADRADDTGAVYRIVSAGASGPPDLVIEALAVSPGTVEAGGTVQVSYRVANRGTGTAAGGFREKILLSSDATLGNDSLRGTSPIHPDPLPPGGTLNLSQNVVVMADTTPGDYFILVRADAFGVDAESNEANNVAAVPLRVQPGTTKDLVIRKLQLSAGSVRAGGTVVVSYDVVNLGAATITESYRERIFLSTNHSVGGDALIGTSHVHTDHAPTLGPNGHHPSSSIVTIPAGTAPGAYFILVQADTFNAVTETRETNNVTPVSITVTP